MHVRDNKFYVSVDKETSECVLIPTKNYFPHRPLREHFVVTMASAEKKAFYFIQLPKTISAKSEKVSFTGATEMTYRTVGQSAQGISILKLKFLSLRGRVQVAQQKCSSETIRQTLQCRSWNVTYRGKGALICSKNQADTCKVALKF